MVTAEQLSSMLTVNGSRFSISSDTSLTKNEIAILLDDINHQYVRDIRDQDPMVYTTDNRTVPYNPLVPDTMLGNLHPYNTFTELKEITNSELVLIDITKHTIMDLSQRYDLKISISVDKEKQTLLYTVSAYGIIVTNENIDNAISSLCILVFNAAKIQNRQGRKAVIP